VFTVIKIDSFGTLRVPRKQNVDFGEGKENLDLLFGNIPCRGGSGNTRGCCTLYSTRQIQRYGQTLLTLTVLSSIRDEVQTSKRH